MKVTAQQLAAILKISVKDAMWKMVAYSGDVDLTRIPKGADPKIYYRPLDRDLVTQKSGIDVMAMVENIQKNYLRKASTRKYILEDYPADKLDKAKEGSTLKLTIPKNLLAVLSGEQVAEIKSEWRHRYLGFKSHVNIEIP